MYKKRIIIVIMVVCLYLSNTFAYEPPVTEGLYLSANYVTQALPHWCWVASAENAIRREMAPATPAYTQWHAVAHIYNGNYPNVYGSFVDTKTAAQFISGWTMNYGIIEGQLSFAIIQDYINSYHPFIAGLNGYLINNSPTGHMVLVRGWKIDGNNRYVSFFDPYPGNGYRQCTYSAFCNGYNGGYYVGSVCFVN